jgi:ribosomal protein S18 acetylase RimI-like enzyme
LWLGHLNHHKSKPTPRAPDPEKPSGQAVRAAPALSASGSFSRQLPPLPVMPVRWPPHQKNYFAYRNKMITNIEELSLNAWASLQTVLYDGWIIRFANGYTKRANSVNPLYPSSMEVDEKLRFCENLYREKKLPVVFKMTSAVYPSNLDDKLCKNGYQKDSPTSVQTVDLEATNLQAPSETEIQDNLSNEWLENFCNMSAISELHRKTLQEILTNIVPYHCFVSLKSNDRVVACGLGVLQSGYVGLFDIVTDKEFRSRGYGQQVVKSILAWGKQKKAKQAYLQVMLDNTPALNLYSRIGFMEQYQYWYRVKA